MAVTIGGVTIENGKIQLRKEDFPLYELLDKLASPGVENMRADFEKAISGQDEAVYQFALGIQTVSRTVPAGAIPGSTQEMMDKTTATCYDIFNYLARHKGHKNAASVVAEYQQLGLDKVGRPAGRSL